MWIGIRRFLPADDADPYVTKATPADALPERVPGGVPADVFSMEQATEALDQATPFIERVAELIQ